MIIHEINMDLVNRSVPPRIDAVQGERESRAIKINLYAAGQPWEAPSGTSAALRFRKPDGKGGLYSSLPDGTAAWSVSGNTITIILARQVLNVAGAVSADIVILNAESILATFPMVICVSPDPSAGVVESENYFEYETLEQINAAVAAASNSAAIAQSRVDNLVAAQGEETAELSIDSGTWEPLWFGGAFPDGVTASGWYTTTGHIAKLVCQLEGNLYGLDEGTGSILIGGFVSDCGEPYSAPRSCPCTNFRVWTDVSGDGVVIDNVGTISHSSQYGWSVGVKPLQSVSDGESHTAIIQFEYIAADAAKTPALQELIDIRVGYDGTTYSSAGTAVREQAKASKPGGASATYNEATGELTITGSGVTYNEYTGELLI